MTRHLSSGTVWKTLGLAAALLLTGTAAAPASPGPKTATPASAGAKTIDVVLCLDTSNSMDGLIASAKVKLWDIVNELAKIKPTPNLRVALYSYGNDGYDRKIGWVRQEVMFTTDLDEVYRKLNGLTTNGGTEYVGRVCRDALAQLKWTEDKSALKLLFVCGNEPASQDPEVKLQAVADQARGKGVIVNPIYCGGADDRDCRDWRQFALMSGGRFANIDQQAGTVSIATPHDKELTALGEKLNTTYLAYGKEGKEKARNQVAQDANAVKAGQGAAAARAQSKGGGLYRNEDWDLVDRLKNDPKFDLSKVPENELPECLKKLPKEKRLAHVKEMAAKRAEIQKQIDEVATKRQKFITDYQKKNPNAADKAFDSAVKGAVREQAAKKGIAIPE